MPRHTLTLLRVSIGLVFLWFGALKLVPGLSPAEGLAGRTLEVMTAGLIVPSVGVPALGLWESLIGLGLLSGRWLRPTLWLLLAHMAGGACTGMWLRLSGSSGYSSASTEMPLWKLSEPEKTRISRGPLDRLFSS